MSLSFKEVDEKSHDQTHDEASHDWKIKRKIPLLDKNIARQFSQSWGAAHEVEENAEGD